MTLGMCSHTCSHWYVLQVLTSSVLRWVPGFQVELWCKRCHLALKPQSRLEIFYFPLQYQRGEMLKSILHTIIQENENTNFFEGRHTYQQIYQIIFKKNPECTVILFYFPNLNQYSWAFLHLLSIKLLESE